MPDILTGPEEIEIAEGISAWKTSLERALLDPVKNAVLIIALQNAIDSQVELIEDEAPSPKRCHCNDPKFLPVRKCEFGHVQDPETGYAANGPVFIPLELDQ